MRVRVRGCVGGSGITCRPVQRSHHITSALARASTKHIALLAFDCISYRTPLLQDGFSPLHLAATQKNAEAVVALLKVRLTAGVDACAIYEVTCHSIQHFIHLHFNLHILPMGSCHRIKITLIQESPFK